jgi:Zn-dependent protease with chaperone function
MIRRTWSVRAALLGLAFAFTSVQLSAQTATEYSDKDKQKLAAIAQRPDVQKRIADAWDSRRREDMEYAFNVNQSSQLAELSPTALAEFRQKFGVLYNNPILSRYVNSLGQKIVPDGSPNLYSFRLLLDPVPRAEALSTGTVYISTGLVALLDDEAQLAYVLGHEIAHVERRHAYNEIKNTILEEEFDKEKGADVQKKKAIFGAVAAVGGAAIGGAAGGASGAFYGGIIGGAAGVIGGALLFRNKFVPTEWSTVYENEADEAGLKYMLDKNYDAREIPRMYARLDNLVGRDSRVGLGFIGNPARTRERQAEITSLLTSTYKADLAAKLKAGLTASGPEFSLLMAALKRDNGVIAMDYDLFAMARDNLEDAVKLRSNDPRVHYYLGRVIADTGRSAEDKQQALTQFLQSIQYDAERGAYPEPHLEEALYQISQNDPSLQDQIKKELKTYVALYQRQHGGALPLNMYIIYDYFLLAGDKNWYVPPAAVVTTKNVDSLFVTTVSTAPSTATSDVINRATNSGSDSGSRSGSASDPAAPVHKPAAKKATGTTPQ